MFKILILSLVLCSSATASAAQYNIRLRCGTLSDIQLADLIRTNSSTDLGYNYYLLKGQLSSYRLIQGLIGASGGGAEEPTLPNLGEMAVKDYEQMMELIASCETQMGKLKTAILQKSLHCDANNFMDLEFSPVASFACESSDFDGLDKLVSELTSEQLWQLAAFEYGKFSAYEVYEKAFITPAYLYQIYYGPAMNCYTLSNESWYIARSKKPVVPACRK